MGKLFTDGPSYDLLILNELEFSINQGYFIAAFANFESESFKGFVVFDFIITMPSVGS